MYPPLIQLQAVAKKEDEDEKHISTVRVFTTRNSCVLLLLLNDKGKDVLINDPVGLTEWRYC